MTRISKRWSVLIWALVALLLCYIDRIIISLAIIEMKPEFGWDDSAKGTILSAFFVGYLVMQVLGGLLANKFGGRNVFLWAVLIWSAFTIATALLRLILHFQCSFLRVLLWALERVLRFQRSIALLEIGCERTR